MEIDNRLQVALLAIYRKLVFGFEMGLKRESAVAKLFVASTFIGTECVPKPSNCAWPPGGSLSFGRIEVTAEFFLEYGEGLPVSRQHVPLMYPRTCTLWICNYN